MGTHTDNLVADAIVKGVPGFNVTLGYQAIRQDAFVVPPTTEIAGRICLKQYVGLGYIPSDAGCSQETSRTLNYYLVRTLASGIGFGVQCVHCRRLAHGAAFGCHACNSFVPLLTLCQPTCWCLW